MVSFGRLGIASAIAVAGMLPPVEADANGNVSHQWVTRTAVANTPAGGSLASIVGDEGLQTALYTGTMFPDWGYAPGATSQERDAGEATHWERLQDAYRTWIMANYTPPWSDEARVHLAFYLGMASHGIGDQTYDAMFFRRSRFYEPGDHDAFDQDTDVLWSSTVGPLEPPDAWVPYEPMLALYEAQLEASLDEASVTQKLGLVAIGMRAVNARLPIRLRSPTPKRHFLGPQRTTTTPRPPAIHPPSPRSCVGIGAATGP